jgi:hypothetical protein
MSGTLQCRTKILPTEADWNADPVALGLVTVNELAAARRHLNALEDRRAQGPADAGALHALTTLWGWPLNGPIYRDSIRYWALRTLFENNWISMRENCFPHHASRRMMLPHEKAGDEVFACCQRASRASGRYLRYSRYWRMFREEAQDHDSIARWESLDRERRKRVLMACRAKHKMAMKAALVAIAKYRAAIALALL